MKPIHYLGVARVSSVAGFLTPHLHPFHTLSVPTQAESGGAMASGPPGETFIYQLVCFATLYSHIGNRVLAVSCHTDPWCQECGEGGRLETQEVPGERATCQCLQWFSISSLL